ncbi:hypothetical protein O6H91_10G013400 [Diphasiastrum complanatum]|uniref:Uncharacterized protein n=1 Tax=Diphasiastrum complanatum TaxID=34168 RepID=A0ACC2CEJ9_DIPCM|nr:hypothetical protein O6H91_10G013400 [Diphasiastrum complanatum]
MRRITLFCPCLIQSSFPFLSFSGLFILNCDKARLSLMHCDVALAHMIVMGKFYSNGLDFAFIRRDMMELLFDALHRLLERFLHFPIPTMAAINGHAVAAGCMLALAHDYRFMRSDKGYIFLNEVEIKLPFSPGMNALIRSKLPVHTYHKAVLSGQRYGGKEAERSGFVDAALPDASSTQEEAIRQASALVMKNLDRATYKAMKEVMFKQEIKELLFGGFGELSKL